MSKNKKIVVAGDVTIDWLQWDIKPKEEKENFSPNWELYSGYHMTALHGGAKLLADMMESAVWYECILSEKDQKEDSKEKSKEEIVIDIISQELGELECIPPKNIIHSNTYIDEFEGVYRVKSFNGFCGPVDKYPPILPIINDDENAEMVIIDDAGNGFREDKESWPKALKNNPIVVLKMSRPLAEGKLWEELVANHADKLVVVLSANDLRDHGANISKHLSWERTALDFVWEITNNPKLKEFKECSNLIVRFGIDGAILYQNQDEIKAKLFYDAKLPEDGYQDKNPGEMQGYGCAFVAAIAACIAKNDLSKLDKIVQNGIISVRRLLDHGFGKPGDKPHYPNSEIFGQEDGSIFSIDIPIDSKNDSWTILEEKTRWKLQSVARNYILKGNDSKLGCIPVGEFEFLKTVDRAEIESYQSIRNLMREYLKRDNPGAPLCIGVFGPPGSGKSFGVVQLANSIDKDRIEVLEFNVSQFESTDDLIDAFHKVRDLVLEGSIPLVFFDEFDSSLEGTKLGWLKYFLAPMNDGEFKHGETMHPIGKSIFVFAGGTSDTFQDFAREGEIDESLTKDEKDKIEADRKDFRSAKGTDFISRLRGHVNVMGPNRQGDNDTFYMIRRALFLRSMIERKAKNILHKGTASIDESVLRAFLKVPKYKHGVRSMGAILEMSMLTDKKKFEQSVLPPQEQLDMHVDAEIFSKLVSRDVLFGSHMENLAQEIHEEYRQSMKGKKTVDHAAMKPWVQLDEDNKNSNRDQALQIPEKLHEIHYDFIPTLEEPKDFEFTKDEIETLAEMEHERWMAERLAKGWKQDDSLEESDHDNKLSPYLIHWDDLTEEVKNWDREPVSNIPKLLKKAGFEIYSLK
jgi:hypothetical protein